MAISQFASSEGDVIGRFQYPSYCVVFLYMRILIVTDVFTPSIGGVEVVSRLLALSLSSFGNDVQVLTRTSGISRSDSELTVIRNASLGTVWRSVCRADIVISMGVPFRLLWPLFVLHKRILVSHHIQHRSANRWFSIRRFLERFLCRNAFHVVPSAYLANVMPFDCWVVGNPYVSGGANTVEDGEHSRDLVFVGRLIPEKGPMILLEAIEILARKGLSVQLTIVGDGPLRPELECFAEEKMISCFVSFIGSVPSESVRSHLLRHRIIVIPSVCEEAFGLVAVEGISCGCGVISSGRGGLPEAVGPCGEILHDLNPVSLADAIEHVLADPKVIRRWQMQASEHLSQFHPDVVATRYLAAMGISNFHL